MTKQLKMNSRLGGLLGAIAVLLLPPTLPTAAQDAFGNEAVQFPVDTIVEFEFVESHGALQSTLGVINLDTGEQFPLFQEVKPYDSYSTGRVELPTGGQNNTGTSADHLGTVEGGTIPEQFREFTFRANTRYAFYLDSVSMTGQTRRTVLSTSSLGAVFDGSLDAGSRAGSTGSRIAWDDTGLPQAGKDQDFDDFVIEAGGYLVNPCPPVR